MKDNGIIPISVNILGEKQLKPKTAAEKQRRKDRLAWKRREENGEN